MKCVVIARFDAETETKLNAYGTAAAKAAAAADYDSFEKTPPADPSSLWPPHLTLAAYDGICHEGGSSRCGNFDTDILCRYIGEVLAEPTAEGIRRETRPKICFSSVGVFPHGRGTTDVVFAAPAPTPELVAFYYAFHSRYDEYAGDYGRLYTASFGFPVLHSTLAICPKESLCSMMQSVCDVFHPIVGSIVAVEVCDADAQILARFNLG